MIRLVEARNEDTIATVLLIVETDDDYELIVNAMLSSIEIDKYGHLHDKGPLAWLKDDNGA